MQDVWREEGAKDRLVKFGGRQWTRFHLPPFDHEGRPCPLELWSEAKDASCVAELETRLTAAKVPDRTAISKEGIWAVTKFADLNGVVFPENFSYPNDALVADLGHTIFVGSQSFSKRVLAWFSGAIFCSDVKLDYADFSVDMSFGGTIFLANASFRDATFSAGAWFEYAMFCGVADFDSASFARVAGFGCAMFSRRATFRHGVFHGRADFSDARFFGEAHFDGTSPFSMEVHFRSAQFHKMADFSSREFKGPADFSGAYFYDIPKFHGGKLHPDTSFLDAEFRDGRGGRTLPRRNSRWFGFRNPWWYGKNRFQYIAARVKWKATLRSYMRWRKVPFGLRRPELKIVRKAHDLKLEQYEISYRQLRRLCGEIGSIEYEGRFHALELKAHRARTDTQMPARIASWLYEKLSDYGRSLSRPLLWLAGSWGVVTLAYQLLFTPPYHADAMGLSAGTCESMGGTPAWNEILVTAGREFLPSLFGMSNTINRPEWLRCAEGAHPLLFFLVSAFQIVVFLTCISLFLIALRRRFQLRD